MSKKIFIISLIATMTFALSGCGANDETATNNASESEVIEEVAETKEIEIVPTQEILDADMESCKVQLGNDFVVELPITLENLMKKGATIPADINPINEILHSGYGKSIDVSLNDITCKLSFDAKEESQLKDCELYGLDSGYYTGYYCPFVLPKGIKVGSTVDELKTAYGEPNDESLDVLDYEFYSTEKKMKIGLTVRIDIENQVVSGLGYDVYPEEEEY